AGRRPDPARAVGGSAAGAGGAREPRARLGAASARLEALSPLAVLARGYALARTADGAVLTDAARVAPGDAVEIALARGRVDCEVRRTDPGGSLERPRRPC
ncbi:MAG: hypothetical protein GYA57_11785, partial [Myxococcales bacterium]|nr:hypothetical protein [Myxococcales bacterium]